MFRISAAASSCSSDGNGAALIAGAGVNRALLRSGVGTASASCTSLGRITTATVRSASAVRKARSTLWRTCAASTPPPQSATPANIVRSSSLVVGTADRPAGHLLNDGHDGLMVAPWRRRSPPSGAPHPARRWTGTRQPHPGHRDALACAGPERAQFFARPPARSTAPSERSMAPTTPLMPSPGWPKTRSTPTLEFAARCSRKRSPCRSSTQGAHGSLHRFGSTSDF